LTNNRPLKEAGLKKIAFLFPGQGSQSVGMGVDFHQEYDMVRETFDMVEDLVKLHIRRLCFKGPMEDLTKTIHLQPAITAVSLSTLQIIEKEGLQADVSAGHSLGEYSALCAARVLTREDTVRAVMKRGELMHREAGKHKGAMTAILGLTIDTVASMVQEAQSAGAVSIANHNMERQIVITGSPVAVEKAAALAVAQHGKAIPLKVSGAWHSDLIKGAEVDFKNFLDTIEFKPPVHPVIHNAVADVVSDPDEIRSVMVKQLCNPVKWYDTLKQLMKDQVDVFVEIGPGKVLSGMLQKTIPSDYPARMYAVNTMKSLEDLLKEIS
jgi:[acyl-carrier-protein] S-malonyltransferase